MSDLKALRYVECPRDSWQGLTRFIPTDTKIAYLQGLLNAGFKHIDAGSFVSATAVPQLADTETVLTGLQVPDDASLLCIIANQRGFDRAAAINAQRRVVHAVGYPLSINDTFQQRNTRKTLAESWPLVAALQQQSHTQTLDFIVYVSMGFGNPYEEPWRAQDTADAVMKLRDLNVKHIVLADTVGTATPERIHSVLELIEQPGQLGLHLHARPGAWREQLRAALTHGLSWFEGALAGVGGCPFATDSLTGNLPTEQVLAFFLEQGFEVPVQANALSALAQEAATIEAHYH